MPRGSKSKNRKATTGRPARRQSRPRIPAPPADQQLIEALEQQAATSEILGVIRRSPNDAQPVFDAIVRSAARLCKAEFSAVTRSEGGLLHLAAISNMSAAETTAYQSLFPRAPARGFIIGRAFLEGRPIHVEDVLADPEYDPRTLHVLQRAAPFRSYLGVPIIRHGVPIGAIGCGRHGMRPFTLAQIELLKTFADQAVIAIENVRLFTDLEARNRDLTDSLEQQTATAEILSAISSSPTDIQPVLDTVVRAAARFCGAPDVVIVRRDGDVLRGAAAVGPFGAELASRSGGIEGLLVPVTRGAVSGRAVVDRRSVHVHDLAAESEDEFPVGRDLQRRYGHHTMLATPLLREGTPLGAILLFRTEVRPFSDRQLELAKIFANQAVIAIENVRLFQELQTRNHALTESLEQQTATGEILRVISASPTDVQPVFETIAYNARRLCNADSGAVYTYDGRLIHLRALDNTSVEGSEALRRAYPREATHGSAGGQAILTGREVHIPDARTQPGYEMRGLLGAGLRSMLAVPMLRGGTPVGVIVVHTWEEPRPFTAAQIDLLRTFADQAVIAIENTRLFQELGARNRDLTESLDQQTATGEILRVISSSPTDAQPVFDTIAQAVLRLCGAELCQVFQVDAGMMHFVGSQGHTPEGLAAAHRAFPRPVDRGTTAGRAILSATIAQIEDVRTDSEYAVGEVARAMKFRALVAVPMIRDGRAIGAISVARHEPGHFSERQIELLRVFADQAVIAVENVRLFTELDARNRELTNALEQQTATGEVLRVISGSATDTQPVFDAIVRSAVRLCRARFALVYQLVDDVIYFAAHHNLPAAAIDQFQRTFPQRLSESGTLVAQAIRRQEVINVTDIAARSDVAESVRELARVSGYRSVLALPIMREGRALGAIAITRSGPDGAPYPFAA
ncbi:MAG TPA: GAF domain-containing protein, partial [Methylomirabilota bacterium]